MIAQSGGRVRYPALASNFDQKTELVVAMRAGGMAIKADDANRHIFGDAVGFDTGTPAGVGPGVRGNRMVGTINGLSTLVVDIV